MSSSITLKATNTQSSPFREAFCLAPPSSLTQSNSRGAALYCRMPEPRACDSIPVCCSTFFKSEEPIETLEAEFDWVGSYCKGVALTARCAVCEKEEFEIGAARNFYDHSSGHTGRLLPVSPAPSIHLNTLIADRTGI